MKKRKLHLHGLSSTILAVVLIWFILLSVFVFTQKNSSKPVNEESTSIIPLPEEKIVNVNVPPQQDRTQLEQNRREGYDLSYKPFEKGNYEYDERTKDFRLVCSKPCPVSRGILDQEFAATTYAVSTLRGLTKSDITKELLPFEVHASEDNRCPMLKEALAYQTIYTDSNGNTRGLLCFFFDKIQYDRSKFPYSTSIHEVTHLFQNGKFPPYVGGGQSIAEGVSEMMDSFFLKGNNKNSFCWEGNAWYKDVLKNSDDPHWVGGNLFFELCRQFGFDYNSLPALFKELDGRNGNVDEKEFVNIINSIVGADTTTLFTTAGVI